MLPFIFGSLALGGLLVAAFQGNRRGSAVPTREQLQEAAQNAAENGDDEVAAELLDRAEQSPPAQTPPPTQENLQEAAQQAAQNGQPDVAAELEERANEAPTEQAVQEQAAVQQGNDLESELARMTPQQREAYEQIMDEDDPANIPRMEEAGDRLAANGFPRAGASVHLAARELAEAIQQAEAATPATPPALPAVTPPVVVPTTPASPTGPAMPQDSAGYNPALARQTARGLATMIASRGYNYDRGAVRAFQRAAGIAIDGQYGPQTRGALIYFGVANPPRPLFNPTGQATIPYTPPV